MTERVWRFKQNCWRFQFSFQFVFSFKI